MKDTDLYSRILGLSSPWFVADVELDNGRRLAEWMSMLSMLPVSGGAVRPVAANRLVGIMPSLGYGRYLDTCQFIVLPSCPGSARRVPEHGVLQVRAPWAKAKGRFTLPWNA